MPESLILQGILAFSLSPFIKFQEDTLGKTKIIFSHTNNGTNTTCSKSTIAKNSLVDNGTGYISHFSCYLLESP